VQLQIGSNAVEKDTHVIVPDGALVLETVRKVHPDLLILDVMMPGLSGIEHPAKVRALCLP
jgi:DNA-binding response OmpR family regulator